MFDVYDTGGKIVSDFDVYNVGDNDSNEHKFFGDMTFKEWLDNNKDHHIIDAIKSMHNIYPEEPYEVIIDYINHMTHNAVLLHKNMKDVFGIDHPDPMEQYVNFTTLCNSFKIYHNVRASDDKGHSENVSVRIGSERVSVRIESRLMGHIRYLIEHDLVEHRLLSDFCRQAIIQYTIMHPLMKDSVDPEHLEFIAYLQAEIDAMNNKNRNTHVEILKLKFTQDLESLVSIINSNIDREERLHEFTENFTFFLGRTLLTPMTGLERGRMKELIVSDLAIRQILTSLNSEGLINKTYVDSIISKGELPKDIEPRIRQEIGLSKKIEQNERANVERKVCCICGSNDTYEYRGDPKWYKKYDENGLWDGESYKCRKCYRARYAI